MHTHIYAHSKNEIGPGLFGSLSRKRATALFYILNVGVILLVRT